MKTGSLVKGNWLSNGSEERKNNEGMKLSYKLNEKDEKKSLDSRWSYYRSWWKEFKEMEKVV